MQTAFEEAPGIEREARVNLMTNVRLHLGESIFSSCVMEQASFSSAWNSEQAHHISDTLDCYLLLIL
jgi:hypothetical protein